MCNEGALIAAAVQAMVYSGRPMAVSIKASITTINVMVMDVLLTGWLINCVHQPLVFLYQLLIAQYGYSCQFLPCDAMHSAVLLWLVVVCSSVCL